MITERGFSVSWADVMLAVSSRPAV